MAHGLFDTLQAKSLLLVFGLTEKETPLFFGRLSPHTLRIGPGPSKIGVGGFAIRCFLWFSSSLEQRLPSAIKSFGSIRPTIKVILGLVVAAEEACCI